MKVLFAHGLPFSLAHGGLQIQIEETRRALQQSGLEVDHLRWWDAEQRGDVLHHFGRPHPEVVRLAQEKGLRVVMSELLTAQGSRGRIHRGVQKWTLRLLRKVRSEGLSAESYRRVDAVIALTEWEAHLMATIYGAPRERLHIIPNGVEDCFFSAPQQPRGKWLVCTATITERKRVLELAQAAVATSVPVWVVGKPYGESDPYYKAFAELARAQPEFIRYEGPVADRAVMAGIYRQARGFVLLSTMESLSLSALEAAACECPLLLGDLPWARTTFGGQAQYCPPFAGLAKTGEALRRFHAAAPNLPLARPPLRWREVAAQLRQLYERL